MARIWNKHKQTNAPLKRKVFVAMSGGVDSSVAAAMLKKQGYDVVGVFMRFWNEPSTVDRRPSTAENTNTCCSEGAEQAARDVAEKLKIPFYVLNVQEEFKKAVVDYFLAAEKKGLTPNPCVVCNKKIKFGLLFEKALGMGADYIATGHYARVKGIVIPSPKGEESRGLSASVARMRGRSFGQSPQDDYGTYKLFQAKDEDKDQSYFLYNLTQGKLSRILFPVGDYQKDDVYKIAQKWKLPYRQGESFDLCFVASDRESFIKRYLKMKAGEIMDLGGKKIGYHQGLALYTIGQRKSLPLQQGPWWVVKKYEKKNILYVSNIEEDLYSKELIAKDINWLAGKSPKLPLKVWAKIRYKSEMCPATLRQAQDKNQFELIFEKPQRAITPGQSVVFYSKNGELLGGGVIKVYPVKLFRKTKI